MDFSLTDINMTAMRTRGDVKDYRPRVFLTLSGDFLVPPSEERTGYNYPQWIVPEPGGKI